MIAGHGPDFAAALNEPTQGVLKINLEKLQTLGTLWEKNGKARIYFNNLPSMFGLETTHYGSGNLGSATIDGEKISNREASDLLSVFVESKLWYDLNDGQFHHTLTNSRKYDGDLVAGEVIKKIHELAAD